jgi:hypothetical protein
MADVTISSLPLGTPSGSGLIPFSTGSQTLASTFNSLSSLPFMPKAYVSFYVYEQSFTGALVAGIQQNYNIVSVSRLSTGRFTITWASNLFTKLPIVTGSVFNGNNFMYLGIDNGANSINLNNVTVRTTNLGGTNIDPEKDRYDPNAIASVLIFGT